MQDFAGVAVPEPSPVYVPASFADSGDRRVARSRGNDGRVESHMDSPALEIAPLASRISPVFQLASVSHGDALRLSFSQQESALADGRLKSNIDAAFSLLVARLSEGESLIATHSFYPEGSGCMGVSSRFHIEREGDSRPTGAPPDKAPSLLADVITDWRGVFRTGLALLCEEYSFRQLESLDLIPQANRVFLQFDSCSVTDQSSMGFTAAADPPVQVSLALWAAVCGSSLWPGTLERTFKAARAQEAAVAVGVRISRFALIGQQRSALEKLDVSSDFQGRIHGAVLSKVKQTFVDHVGEFLRVEPFIEVTLDPMLSGAIAPWSSRRVSALVDVFAKEVLPLHTGGRLVSGVERPRFLPCTNASVGLDLTTAMPFSGSLPPLLANPEALRDLDFPRHHVNSALRLPQDGLLLGAAQVGGFEHEVRLRQADRSRHVYMVGGTGVGKTKAIFHMIRQDMDKGGGLALGDPAGDLFEEVLEHVPDHRLKDVVVIDPSDASMAVGLNPLDLGDNPSPLAVNHLTGDLLDIFDHLYDMKTAGGPGFEQFFRYTMLLAATAPYESPSRQDGCPSFFTVLALLRDKDWRDWVLSKARMSFLGEHMANEVVEFFKAAEATSGETSFRNWVPYISNKLTRFTDNPLLRPLLCSRRRTIDFRKIMDEQKILLVNLSKGAIGALDAKMIGMLITKGLFGAAMSRFDLPRARRVPFTYYCDEFQDYLSPDIGAVLDQGRKWGLQMVLGHQSIGQLRTGTSRATLDAVLGNVPTRLIFRTGIEDAALLEQALQPQINRLTLSQLADRQVAARLLIDNKVSMPFIFTTQTVLEDRSQAERVQSAASARKFSRERYGIAARDCMLAGAAPPPALLPAQLVDGVAVSATTVNEIKPLQSLMKGFVKLRGTLTRDESSKLAEADRVALVAWLQTAQHTTSSSPVKPMASRLYRTSNRSLVFVTSVDGNGDAKAVVLEGGHRDAALPGERPGSSFDLMPTGEYCSKLSSSRLLGMLLQMEIEVREVSELCSAPQRECSFNWLLQQELANAHTLKTVGGSFYQTLDGSVVYVTCKQDADGEYKAVVLSGGHGIDQLRGTTATDFFFVDSSGTYCLASELAKKATPAKIAAASGMSLARRLDAPALDAQEAESSTDLAATSVNGVANSSD